MNLPATIANSLWIGSSLPSLAGFEHALRRPAQTQQKLLRALLARHAGCAYGRAHDFASIRSYEEFARRVPLINYDDLGPWIERLRFGEPRVLTSEPVTHLIPTGGSTGARKLIPFTAGLQREFQRAIGPWVADLARRHPGILFGPAYWSITPASQPAERESSVVPIGFANDVSYLGGVKSRLARAALVAPDEADRITDLEEFRYRTLLCLLLQRDLRLISVWHPSFLGLLLDELPDQWEKLLAVIHKTQKRRARELEHADPFQPESLWPHLEVVSCWGDAHAGLALADLRRRFPHTHLQPKGLLATEAFVTIPFQGAHPIAVDSHCYEFIDEAGCARLVHELREGGTYEVVVTTGGGLWRYRLGDLVQVNGRVGETPSMRFLGRNGNVSDRFGEKLSEGFVGEVIREAMAGASSPPHFAMLAPEDGAAQRYVLYLEGVCEPQLAARVDELLQRNPNYAWCRNLGQLQAVEIFEIRRSGYETFVAHETGRGRRLGEIKASPLSPETGWSQRFSGSISCGINGE
jgi:hypothetical protein